MADDFQRKMEVTTVLLVLLSTYFDVTDAKCLTIKPDRLVVKYGDPAYANCTSATPEIMGWEAIQGGVSLTDDPRTFLLWTVKTLTDYNIKPTCFLEGGKCKKDLNVAVYKPPANVSMSGPAGPMVEGKLYEYRCRVQDVAPASCLYVSLYKAFTTSSKTEIVSHPPNTTNTIKVPQSGEYPLLFLPSRGDDGAQLWCSARLEMGEQGPQPPPQMDSEHLTLSVLLVESQQAWWWLIYLVVFLTIVLILIMIFGFNIFPVFGSPCWRAGTQTIDAHQGSGITAHGLPHL
ncbi:hypothetical protein UPYG_G00054700 [Umbra pygmaea]|uniref:Uncharacterized protein n=1 Tax=Umbra pygmaea TaxID=75934 RepID=A0ABD0X7Z7_UMBPY